jgi:hypothetical protein
MFHSYEENPTHDHELSPALTANLETHCACACILLFFFSPLSLNLAIVMVECLSLYQVFRQTLKETIMTQVDAKEPRKYGGYRRLYGFLSTLSGGI